MKETQFDIRFDCEFVKTVAEALAWRASKSDEKRRIIITPFRGAYGIAGCVCCIEGSPPRGTLIIENSGTRRLIGITSTGGIRVADEYRGSEAMQWLRTYLLVHLRRQGADGF